jgi:methylglutaconyl-CoA hydratase
MNGTLHTRVEAGIATICFAHPQSNSMPGDLLRRLALEIELLGKSDEVRVMVLESEGNGAFCAGASFDELVSINDFETGKRFFSGFAQVILAMRNAPKFVVARIQGKAVGGGVGLAAAADLALATEQASVKLSELAVGIGPFVVGPAVERKVGTSAFSQMSIDAGRWQSAAWAERNGLFYRVFPDVETLNQEVQSLAVTLAAYSPMAMHDLKKVLWAGTDHWETLLYERAEISGRLVLSEFTRNAIARFKSGQR